jgi:hypothetical protein
MLKLLVAFRRIDRRIIATLTMLMLALPLIFNIPLTIVAFPATTQLKAYIDGVPKDKLIVVAADWDASTKGECQPLTTAVIDYLMKTDHKFAVFGFIPQGPELVQEICEELAPKHGKTYGVDWVTWGYRPQYVQTLIALMNDIPGTMKTDIKKVPLDQYPITALARNLKEVGLLYEVTGTSLLNVYLQFAAGVPLANGCTAVIGPEQYPYLQSGQLKGLLVGLGGAAQFETVTGFRTADGGLGKGMRGMGSQSLGHFLVMLLIVLGNLGVWAAARTGAEMPPPPIRAVADEEEEGLA